MIEDHLDWCAQSEMALCTCGYNGTAVDECKTPATCAITGRHSASEASAKGTCPHGTNYRRDCPDCGRGAKPETSADSRIEKLEHRVHVCERRLYELLGTMTGGR